MQLQVSNRDYRVRFNHNYIAVALTLLVSSSCKETPEEVELTCTSEEIISYQTQVAPILQASCNTVGCHSSNFSAGDFTTFNGITPKIEDGSLLQELSDGTMPPSSPLSAEELQILICWIENGASNN